jgi:hypothetical protein
MAELVFEQANEANDTEVSKGVSMRKFLAATLVMMTAMLGVPAFAAAQSLGTIAGQAVRRSRRRRPARAATGTSPASPRATTPFA